MVQTDPIGATTVWLAALRCSRFTCARVHALRLSASTTVAGRRVPEMAAVARESPDARKPTVIGLLPALKVSVAALTVTVRPSRPLTRLRRPSAMRVGAFAGTVTSAAVTL